MQYNYSITSDIQGAALNSSQLSTEIGASSIVPSLDRIDTSGDSIFIIMSSDISVEEKSVLDALVFSHVPIVEVPIPETVEVINQVHRPAFAEKTLEDGSKLYRRKHSSGWTSVPANSNVDLIISVPYLQAKVDRAEIVGCREGDCVDLSVHDTPTGTVSTVPYYKLNQFGFNVGMSDGLYIDESDYDADLIQGMEVRVTYFNNSTEVRNVCANITLHEVVSQ